MTCRKCGREIATTEYGYGATSPAPHCYHVPALTALGRAGLSASNAPGSPGRASRIHGTRADNESRPPERVGRST